ncbi:hypothetical protein D3C72_2280730 [compost metagenome]
MSGCSRISAHCTMPSPLTSRMPNTGGSTLRHCTTHCGSSAYDVPTRCSKNSYLTSAASVGADTYSSAMQNTAQATELRVSLTEGVV